MYEKSQSLNEVLCKQSSGGACSDNQPINSKEAGINKASLTSCLTTSLSASLHHPITSLWAGSTPV